MKQKVIKPLFLLMISWISTGIVLLGYNPISISWYGAINVLPGLGMMALPITAGGLYYYQGFLAAVKYAMVLIASGMCINVYKKCNCRASPFALAAINGVSMVAMELADWSMKNQDKTKLIPLVPITMLTWSLTVIFAYGIRKFMEEKGMEVWGRNSNHSWPIKANQYINLPENYVNTETILKTAKAFRQIALKMRSMNSEQEMEMNYQQNFVGQQIDECICQGCVNSEIQYLERARLNYLWYSKMVETREAMAIQFNEMSQIVEEFLKPNINTNLISRRQVERLQSKFKEKKILTRKIVVAENEKGRYDIRIQARKKKRSKATIEMMENIVSQYVGRKMRSVYLDYDEIPAEYGQFYFLEEPNFHTLHGVARMIKDNENVSGDNFTYVNMENGQTLMSVCDGMGSGNRANEYSSVMIELLEQLLESGLNEETALRLVNSVLVTKSGWDEPTTLDMGLVDLYSGTCRFLKSGAACTYIKRGNWVECIRSTSLPIGVFNEVDVETITKKLYNGDFVIMISDGIVDSLQCADKEKAMARLIMDIETNNPKEMALTILNQSLQLAEGIPKDDMTVLVTGIWGKT